MDMMREARDPVVAAVRRRFFRYVRPFVSETAGNRGAYLLKVRHSIRVRREISGLARDLGLGPAPARLAAVLGLLHDIGRFEQYAVHGTFTDSRSVDHGVFGARVVERIGILAPLDDHRRDIVTFGIRHHNQASLPADAPADHLLFARLVRDADKLDIFRLIARHGGRLDAAYCDPAGEPLPADRSVSPPVAAAITEGRIVAAADVRNRQDLILLRMGWVADINTRPALVQIRRRGVVDALAAHLQQTNETTALVDRIRRMVERRISQVPATVPEHIFMTGAS